MGFAADDFPEAMAYYREAISLPMFQGLRDEQQDTVVDCLRRALS
jgi:dTDP-4-amino-4,6-dideoxygalactose transaminase